MARRTGIAAAEDDSDDLHPRRSHRLFGHGEALTLAAKAIRAGRPPQALMIGGPPGIGKATLGYRIARYLLAFGATAKGPADLAVPEDDPAAKLIVAGAHPGLMALSRRVDPASGKMKSVLEVDEVRKLAGFFGLTAGMGGWRIALIDAVDDMNDFAANATLKILEEPPARSMLILISHAPTKVLATIRSRCRLVSLRPLGDADMKAALADIMPDCPPAEYDGLIRLAGGSPGAALRLASGDGVALAAEAEHLLDAATPDVPALMALAEKMGRIPDGLALFGDFLVQALGKRIRDKARAGGTDLRGWIDALERIERDMRDARARYLDPRQTVLQAARAVRDAACGGDLRC